MICCRPHCSTDEASAKQGLHNDGRHPIGLLKALAVGASIGVASALLYLWWAEWQRQDDLAWEYYRTH